MPSKNEARRLADNIDRAERHIGDRDFSAFMEDEVRVDAVERCLQRITEACMKIGRERMVEIAPDQPFAEIAGLGNMLRHEYDGLSHRVLWNTVRHDLPRLRAACAKALAD